MKLRLVPKEASDENYGHVKSMRVKIAHSHHSEAAAAAPSVFVFVSI